MHNMHPMLKDLPLLPKPIRRAWHGDPINPHETEEGVFITVEYEDGTGQEYWNGEPLWLEGLPFGEEGEGAAEFDPDFYIITQIV